MYVRIVLETDCHAAGGLIDLANAGGSDSSSAARRRPGLALRRWRHRRGPGPAWGPAGMETRASGGCLDPAVDRSAELAQGAVSVDVSRADRGNARKRCMGPTGGTDGDRLRLPAA